MERSTHGSQMLVELGSSQVHSSSLLRQELSENASEILLAAMFPSCTELLLVLLVVDYLAGTLQVAYHILSCFSEH